jgi:hypothetical protein
VGGRQEGDCQVSAPLSFAEQAANQLVAATIEAVEDHPDWCEADSLIDAMDPDTLREVSRQLVGRLSAMATILAVERGVTWEEVAIW